MSQNSRRKDMLWHISRNQIRWAESCISRMFPKCMRIHNHTRCVHMFGAVVRRRPQTGQWTPISDVKTFCSVLRWTITVGSSGFCNCFSRSFHEMCKMNTELRLWLGWLSHGVYSSALLTWRAILNSVLVFIDTKHETVIEIYRFSQQCCVQEICA
jgi:hypothetical protein